MSTSRFNLISEIDREKKGKKFQVYEARLGIERGTVLVPLERVEEFDALLESENPRSLAKLRALVKKVGGELE